MSSHYIPNELRQQVIQLANSQCEYCLLPETFGFATFHIDHIISEKHGGKASVDNLAYSCPIFNQRKGSDIASIERESELVPLYKSLLWSHVYRLKIGYN